MLKSIKTPTQNTFNPAKAVYLLLAIAGSIVPWVWLIQDPAALMSPTLFLQRAFANHIAAALTSDLLISGVVFLCLTRIELRRLQVSQVWLLLYIGLTLGIGLSCALPFFLYRREHILEQTTFIQ